MERRREEKKTGGNRLGEQPKKQKRKSRLTRQQKLLAAVAVLLAVVLAVVAACQSLFVQPEIPNRDNRPTQEGGGIDYGEGVQPKAGGARKSDAYYTVLILGRDTGGGGNTDTMLLASYDVTNQKATVMSIPRDTMVNVSWDLKKINSVYNWYGGGDKGIQAVYKEIAQLVGFEPDYQVVVEWEAIGEIVDAMGGVWFDVPRDMKYNDPYQDLVINVDKGYQKLDGEAAMGVIRWRHNNSGGGYPDGDLGRIKTQQAFLKAVVEQLLQVKNVTKIGQFAQVFQKNVETDLSFNELLWFGQQAVMGGLSVENVSFVTMPNTPVSCWSRTVKNMQSYVVPKARELLDLVNNSLSPFVEASTLRDLDIMSVNADGSISSTTGHVEDSTAAKPPVKPAKPAEEPTDEPVVDENGNIIDPETGEIIGTATDPGTTDPGTTQPGTSQPGTSQPGTTDPGTTQPGTSQPGTTDPGTTQPGTTQPGTTDPGTNQPGTNQPGTTDPGTNQPGTTDPVTPPEGGGEPPATEPEVPTEPNFSIIEPPPAA